VLSGSSFPDALARAFGDCGCFRVFLTLGVRFVFLVRFFLNRFTQQYTFISAMNGSDTPSASRTPFSRKISNAVATGLRNLTSTWPVMSTSVHKSFGSLHPAPQRKFKRRAYHEVPTLDTRNLCGSLGVCLSSKVQEALYNQGCTGTGEPVLDFWYVPRGLSRISLTPSWRSSVLKSENLKGTSGISWPKKLEGQRGGSSRSSGVSFVGTVRLGYASPFIKNICQGPALVSSTETAGTCIQEDFLWIADPKAINHILQKSGYLYAKTPNAREGITLLTGPGIFWAEGEWSIAISPFFWSP